MGDIKVSVIIPVYNSEKYLRQCLDSVIGQTLKEIEIICVDDGSTDSSPEILEAYKEADPRVSVFRQQNQYAGAARNNGMEHAAGEYLVFWDSDDYFDASALEKMYGKAAETGADVCLCDAKQFYEGPQFETEKGMYLNHRYLPETVPFSRRTHPDVILNVINAAPWTKMFRTAFIREYGLRFQLYRNGEDVYFVECALALAERVTYVDEPLVCYRRNQQNSLLATMTAAPTDSIDAWIAIRNTLEAHDAFPVKSFRNKVMSSMVYMLRNLCGSFSAFAAAFHYLKDPGLEKLTLADAGREDFYDEWHADCLERIRQDTPEEFMAWLFRYTYFKLTEVNAKRINQSQKAKAAKDKLKKEKDKLKEERDARKIEKKDLIREQRALEKKIGDLEKECAGLRNRLEALEAERDSLAMQNGTLSEELQKTARKLEETLQSNPTKWAMPLCGCPER